jgi:CubicO group peptidase (beta-lactamase class C family)
MTTTSIEIHGQCDPAFERVREAFERNFREHSEVGASVAVTIDGQPVVDLWAGYADGERTRPWERDTIVNVYSTTKGIATITAHMLADRGLLDLEAPVVEYWPEFGQAGKERIPVKWLLSHQAGLPVIDKQLHAGGNLEWETMVQALEEQAPVWEPGTKQGYHTVTWGWLAGEVVRRVSGKSVGTFVRDEIAGPLGADFLIGFGPEEDHRVAEMLRGATGTSGASAASQFAGADSLTARSFNVCPPKPGVGVNDREYRAAEIPAGNGHGNARALARIYGALARGGEVDGTRLMSPQSIERARAEQVFSADEILIMKTRRSMGFMLPVKELGDVRHEDAFGHAGMGGSIGWADPVSKIGFGYAMNQMWTGGLMTPDPRAQGLARAVYESL